MRYGYQDMPDGYSDVNPAKEDTHLDQTCLVCGEEYNDLVEGICSDCATLDEIDAIHYGGRKNETKSC